MPRLSLKGGEESWSRAAESQRLERIWMPQEESGELGLWSRGAKEGQIQAGPEEGSAKFLKS